MSSLDENSTSHSWECTCGWPFPYYPFFLIYDFVIALSERLQPNLAVAVLFTVAYIVLLAVPALDALEDALADMFWILSACTLFPAFLGFWMQNLNFANPFHRWVIIFVSSFILIMVVYEFFIRRVNVVRWLCGMKPLIKTTVTQRTVSPVEAAQSR